MLSFTGMQRLQHKKQIPREEEDGCEMCEEPFVFHPELQATSLLSRTLGQEKVPLFRHYSKHEPWPDVLPSYRLPGQVSHTVHYLWCSQGHFKFHHYLGVLSILRLLQPIKLVFYYHHLPQLDELMYNTWFLELKQSVANLVLRSLPPEVSCASWKALSTLLSFMQQDGGIFVRSGIIIYHVPRDLHKKALWSTVAQRSSNNTFGHALIISSRGFNESAKDNLISLEKSSSTSVSCDSPKTFQLERKLSDDNIRCIVFPDEVTLFPKDIMVATSSFAELCRWLFYGKRAPRHPNRIPDSIPRISHLVWFSRSSSSSTELQFYQFVTLLSALYVGGFHHVYVHGNKEFSGRWWQMLKGENISFVYMEEPETVFQQSVNVIEHKSDVARFLILYKYGGAYQDFEAMWTQRVPDWLLSYPAVVNSDWVQNGEWPDNFNFGVLLARPSAPYLRHVIDTQRFFIDKQFVFNSNLMTYRTYERHPEQLFLYRHLQVMCYYGLCHPTWHEGFMRSVFDKRTTKPFDWRKETLAVHVNAPDPEKSLVSPEALARGNDMFADIAKYVLKMSGREAILR